MFKLPVCPNCKATYYYKDVKKSAKKSCDLCHHCKKEFKVKKFAGFAVLAVLVLIAAVALDVIFLVIMPSFSFLLLFSVAVAFILIGYFMYPFFVSFKQIKNDKE